MQGAGLLTACLCTLVVFLVLSGQVRPAEATRDNWDIEDNDDVLYWIDRFALKEDGTWSMQIDPVQKVPSIGIVSPLKRLRACG
jgi:hypothetical protein